MIATLFRCWFARLTGKPEAPLAHLQVQLYTRQGCHLCEVAWEHLVAARQRYRFELAAIDVDTSPELRALHGEQVPVVEVDGKVRFRGGLNPILLERLLVAETRRRPRPR